MIAEGIVVMISTVTASVFAFRAGIAYADRKFINAQMCRHIWGPWEDTSIGDWIWINGSKTKVSVPGQCRDCMSCGEREARKVTA